MVGEEKMAIQIIADLYDCSMLIDDMGAVTEAPIKPLIRGRKYCGGMHSQI